MTGILTITLFCGIIFAYIYTLCLSDSFNIKKNKNSYLSILICVIAAAIRIIAATTYRGHNTDMSCFEGWSTQIFENGISAFYKSEGFHDYPPGYMYILYIIGWLKSLIPLSENLTWLILKLPAIVCDILTGLLIFEIANKNHPKTTHSIFVLSLYLFNPAVILNSSIWGQVDSVYTLFVILLLYMLTGKQLISSYFVFAICIFIKPQAFMFFPLIVFTIVENIFMPRFNPKAFAKNLLFVICAIAVIVLLSLPFGLLNVVNQYINTLESYAYFTVNAFNIWGALGQNWVALTPFAIVLEYILLAAIVIYSAYVFFKSNSLSKYFFVGAILSFMTFMLSTKMHDRYAFPTMALLIAAYAMNKCPRNFLAYSLITLSQFFNTAWVLFVYEKDINKYYASPIINVASFVNIAIMIFFVIYTQKYYLSTPLVQMQKKVQQSQTSKKQISTIKKTVAFEKLKKFDYIFIVSIMLIYSCIAFYRLGDIKAPQTETNISANTQVIIELEKEEEISSVMMFLGSYNLDDTRILGINYCNSAKEVIADQNNSQGSVFCWNMFDVPEEVLGKKVRFISLSSNNPNLTIKEAAIINKDGNIITPLNLADKEINAMFDEQSLVPKRSTFMNSTYFDEIYHARTAYEFINKLEVYEWTHPPLGKVLMALGIKIFGMTPFGWRFMGTLFGILMIPIIYLFAKRLCKNGLFAAITCIIFTFDFMHFAQTRIATIDVYVTFFIMLMYMFMYRYFTMSFYDTPLKKTLLPLGLCGISMGLGIASKWTGVYAGIGLAVLFLITLYRRYKEYVYAKDSPDSETNGIKHKHIIEIFSKNTLITIGICVIFFVLIPIIIYAASYIPYLKAPSSNGISTIIQNQRDMFVYHSDTVVNSTHPFSSKWYEWIIVKRPIFYYSGTVSEGIKEGISSFGNPAVWWLGVPAFVYMLYNAARKKDKTALFIVIGYLAQLVSWVPVTRTTYIYHYFPSVPFVALMIGYSIYLFYRNATVKKRTVISASIAYVAVVVALFALFYPVLSGAPCSVNYADTWLKWFDSWVLL